MWEKCHLGRDTNYWLFWTSTGSFEWLYEVRRYRTLCTYLRFLLGYFVGRCRSSAMYPVSVPIMGRRDAVWTHRICREYGAAKCLMRNSYGRAAGIGQSSSALLEGDVCRLQAARAAFQTEHPRARRNKQRNSYMSSLVAEISIHAKHSI